MWGGDWDSPPFPEKNQIPNSIFRDSFWFTDDVALPLGENSHCSVFRAHRRGPIAASIPAPSNRRQLSKARPLFSTFVGTIYLPELASSILSRAHGSILGADRDLISLQNRNT